MRNTFVGIALIFVVIFGALYIQQTRKADGAQAVIQGLQQKVADQEAELVRQQKQTASLRNRLEDSRRETFGKSDGAAQLKPALANGTPEAQTNAKPASPFAEMNEMLKNPTVKETLRQQQKAVISATIDKEFAQFFSYLHGTPDQTAYLKELMINKELTGVEMTMAAMSGDTDADKRGELAHQIKDQTDAADAQIKQFLGDDNYAQFQAYEKSVGERNAVRDFRDQLAAGSSALIPYQEQQLVQAMTEARQNFKFTDAVSNNFGGDPASSLSQEKIDRRLQEQAQLDQQYLTRAQTILSSDQLAAFQKFLIGQEAAQKAFLQMGAKMFAPK